MGLIVERSQALLAEPGGAGRFGFYTSGQLGLEEYYTLAVIAKAGIGTAHMDGNTRLCTATAAASLKESFGTDGQPGSYGDIDECDALALWGHNVAETQPVLWMRMLDRRRGNEPAAAPGRRSATDGGGAARPMSISRLDWEPTWRWSTACCTRYCAEVGTTRPTSRPTRSASTRLAETVARYPVSRVAEICDVTASDVSAAAELVGTCERLVSTVLQGFYQSHQATAAACLVNDIHLVRGMLGRPRRRCVADEWPTDGAEHQRDRCRR